MISAACSINFIHHVMAAQAQIRVITRCQQQQHIIYIYPQSKSSNERYFIRHGYIIGLENIQLTTAAEFTWY